ncbi:MAG TPA: SusD/RagB family nutrient-binding outer membrane lipoprotein [Puia sp.]|nr:SusD/RagB family nutrient-binding outer membrane lipoprotein [Puia sp.]
MKNNLKTFILGLTVVLLTGSCKKYLDINTNPNAAASAPLKGLLAHATNGTAINTFEVSTNMTSYYVQYLASPSSGSDLDTYNPIDPSGTWGDIYDLMTDIHDMRAQAASQGAETYVGVSDILMAYNLNMSLNIWGDIPYSEAFQGVSNLQPKYDNQQDLYDTCLALLDEGIALLSDPANDGTIDAPSDFIHGGNNAAWVKTAYALKARLLNEVSKTSQYDASKVLAALTNAYGSNSDDAQVTQFDGPGPWAQVAINNAGLDLDGWLSTHFVSALNDSTFGVFDPRLPLITQVTKFGDYRGTINGKGRVGSGTNHEECYLDVDKWYSSPGAPLQLITYPECKFIEAEAQLRAGQPAKAYDAYLAGIVADMQRIGVADTAITRYTSEPTVAVGAGALTIGLILKEKYVACFLNPVTWDDARRFDYQYKDFNLPYDAQLSEFIRRVDYPTSEISRNGKNVPSVSLTDRLWWDQ